MKCHSARLRYSVTRFAKLEMILASGALALSAIGMAAQETADNAQAVRQEASAPAIPGAPRTPAEMPPNLPKVTCNAGQLTISATNSTLGAVLNAIHSCIGAEIEVPAGARSERLFAELGPGPARAVLAEFLNSTDLNYVIKASPSDPQTIQMVLLNPRGNNDSAAEVARAVDDTSNLSANRRAWLESRRNYEQSVSPPDEVLAQETEATSSSSTSAPVDAAAAPENSVPPERDTTSIAPVASLGAPAATGDLPPNSRETTDAQSHGNKTQDLIGDMRRLFEQRRLMTQQQSATAK